MGKIAVGRDAVDAIDLDAPIEDNLAAVARAKGMAVDELSVCILDRPRHEQELVRRVRRAGSRIKYILDGDVAGAILAASPGTGVDLLVGIGGTPEGVMAASALECLGGRMLARLHPRNDDERQRAGGQGYDLTQILTTDDLVRGDNVFFAATGVTDGELLRGVPFGRDEVTNQSLSMRSRSGAIRKVDARHQFGRSNLIF